MSPDDQLNLIEKTINDFVADLNTPPWPHEGANSEQREAWIIERGCTSFRARGFTIAGVQADDGGKLIITVIAPPTAVERIEVFFELKPRAKEL